jgi:hypothetical protein
VAWGMLAHLPAQEPEPHDPATEHALSGQEGEDRTTDPRHVRGPMLGARAAELVVIRLCYRDVANPR